MPHSKFLLRCCHGPYPDIELPHAVEVIVGRNVSTKIKDFRLSRKHTSLTANEKEGKIEVKQLGANRSFYSTKISFEDTQPLRRGHRAVLRAGDSLELLRGKYKYKVTSQIITSPLRTLNTTNVDKMHTPEPHKNHWSQALYATMKDSSMVEYEDDEICIVKDRYPKARHHYLVLPKEKIIDLSYMNESHVQLLRDMVKRARELTREKKIQSFKMGFHCVPSLAQVHMHIISDDFDSPCLKNKKHWNSFNTDYFISPDKVIQFLEEDGKVPFDLWKSQSKEFLSRDLMCHKCDFKPKNLPDLKKHLTSHIK